MWETIYEWWTCTVHGTADGQKVAIPLLDIDVELPIASIRKCVKHADTVMSHEDGGGMENKGIPAKPFASMKSKEPITSN